MIEKEYNEVTSTRLPGHLPASMSRLFDSLSSELWFRFFAAQGTWLKWPVIEVCGSTQNPFAFVVGRVAASSGSHPISRTPQTPHAIDIRAKPYEITTLTGTKDLQTVNITIRVLSRPEVPTEAISRPRAADPNAAIYVARPRRWSRFTGPWG